jgi:hypothetical protein
LNPQNEGLTELKIENSIDQNDLMTSQKIAKDSNLGEATVKRAALFSKKLDTIYKNTGINKHEILRDCSRLMAIFKINSSFSCTHARQYSITFF